MTNLFSAVFNEYPDHHHKDDNVEDEDDKDRAEECTKKQCSIGDEAAGERYWN